MPRHAVASFGRGTTWIVCDFTILCAPLKSPLHARRESRCLAEEVLHSVDKTLGRSEKRASPAREVLLIIYAAKTPVQEDDSAIVMLVSDAASNSLIECPASQSN